jgi:hypothetical protein
VPFADCEPEGFPGNVMVALSFVRGREGVLRCRFATASIERVIDAQYLLRIKVRTMEQVASDGGRMPITSAVCLIRLFVA